MNTEVIWINIHEVKTNPSNPRIIKDDKFAKLVESIKSFPEMLEKRPIIVNTEHMVLGGNMRLKACKEAGLKQIPIMVADWTPEQQREFTIKDNASFGEWDWEELKLEWADEPLADWGLDVPEAQEILAAEEDNYEVPEGGIQTDIVLGDLFEIGPHRLLCGDSTDSEAVARLMKGEKADMAFTSPPYNAGKSEMLSGNTHTTDNKYGEYNDNKNQSDYLDLLIGFTNNALINAKFLICNIQSLSGNKVALIEYLYKYKNNIIDVAIWDKGHGAPAMAENVMTSAWEYMIFISPKEKATRAIPNAGFRGTVLNIYRGTPNRNNEFSSVHAATFPVDLPEWAMQFTKQDSTILDQFIGTGTTMVAAHQLNRKCYGMELDPKYCQVIVDRMLKLDPSLEVKRNGEKYVSKTAK